MVRRALPLVLLAACGFRAPSASDANSDAGRCAQGGAERPPLAENCFGSTVQVCLATLPTASRTLPSSINTGSTTGCAMTTFSSVPVCVIAGTSLALSGGSTTRATGPMPLILIATTGTIEINGTLDLASRRGQTPGAGAGGTCAPGTAPTKVGIISGGGQGGGLGFIGGSGGTTSGGIPGEPPGLATLRGGCVGAAGEGGGGGAGGNGGGAVALIAPSITVSGTINASGAGGQGGNDSPDRGGGGGGSGGAIVLDTPSLTITGSVFARGGGGGGGGGGGSNGSSGGEATATSPASGGNGSGSLGGDGGAGSTDADGSAGTGTATSGGGGGGGGGVICTTAPAPVGATSPPLT